MQKKYIIFDLDGTLIRSNSQVAKIVYDYIYHVIDPGKIEQARYLYESFGGISNKEVLEKIGVSPETLDYHAQTIEHQINAVSDDIGFFHDTIEVISELTKNYTLMLSTGSSDSFANIMLEKGNIKKHFSYILGSTYIQKSTLHIEKFIDYTGDENFTTQALFVGDGGRDKEIAEAHNIDFIGIGNQIQSNRKIELLSELIPLLENRE